jgi:hypothetical protein
MNEPHGFDLSRFPRETLRPMNASLTESLGEALAGIDPWLRLGALAKRKAA